MKLPLSTFALLGLLASVSARADVVTIITNCIFDGAPQSARYLQMRRIFKALVGSDDQFAYNGLLMEPSQDGSEDRVVSVTYVERTPPAGVMPQAQLEFIAPPVDGTFSLSIDVASTDAAGNYAGVFNGRAVTCDYFAPSKE